MIVFSPVKTSDLLPSIQRALPELRKSERRVADYVLAHPDDVVHMRIVDLASEAEVSEPTVVRFCRAIGCDGFQEFKVRLARRAETPRPPLNPIRDNDSLSELRLKVIDNTLDLLRDVREQTDVVALTRAVHALCRANRVEFYGFGASGAVAAAAQHTFFQLQMTTAAYTDPHMQRLSALSLGSGDVVVAISRSGRTTGLMGSVTAAHQAGATVIGLCPAGSPLAQRCSVVLAIAPTDEPYSLAPVASQVAQLVTLDVLAAAVARAKGPALREHIARLERGLQTLQLSPDAE